MLILVNPIRFFIVLVLVFNTGLVLAQSDTLNQIDSLGRKQGAWRKIDQAGRVVYTGQFRDNQPIGKFLYYNAKGGLDREMFFRSSTVTYVILYWENNKKQAEGIYINQQKDSIWRFYDGNAQLISEDQYKAGKRNGFSKVYYSGTKQIFEQRNYLNDLQDGPWIQYYANGQKKAEGTYKNDNPIGRAVWYFEDGRINIMGNYANGLKDGTWIFNKPDGTLRAKQVWKAGKIISGEELITPEQMRQQQQQYNQENGEQGNEQGGGQ